MLRILSPKFMGGWSGSLRAAQATPTSTPLTLIPSCTAIQRRAFNFKEKSSSGQRKIRQVRPVDQTKQHRLQAPAAWKPVPPVPTSPMGQTLKPAVDLFEAHEAEMEARVRAASVQDGPSLSLQDQDPYVDEPIRCILCPKRYTLDIYPSYKNPKLLAQFVSPHTGRTYEAHITGLCADMQDKVEREVKKAQKLRLLATEMKEVHYLKDPSLFNPVRPLKKNPY
ncbi:hypothetical protein TCAL_03843 [Tigriopus californicus]|uniref:28S ribosomal protein S18b, mitochondrial n=1 Tax=Tigriopus californicus TaxID=6832 RepID=A0A553PFB9_TIGCA|nr:uncharacterized protein LOC131881300 [Tigriopus californicus]TRY76382.1 hypothetical protein TCAL_03843 [Tigriopus californicus]